MEKALGVPSKGGLGSSGAGGLHHRPPHEGYAGLALIPPRPLGHGPTAHKGWLEGRANCSLTSRDHKACAPNCLHTNEKGGGRPP